MFKTKTEIAIIIFTLVTITVNILSNILPFNNITTAEVSAKFITYFVPAGYVFAIWGLIYILLLVFAFGNTVVPKKERAYVNQIAFWYVLSSVANIAWLFAWHYQYLLTTGVAMVALLFSLIGIQLILQKNTPKSLTEKITIHLPFNVYLGWISVATIANITDILWYYNFNTLGLSGQTWAGIMMIIAALLAVAMTLFTTNVAFSLVIIWAIIGILVKFPADVVILSTGLTAIGFIAMSLVYKFFPTKKK